MFVRNAQAVEDALPSVFTGLSIDLLLPLRQHRNNSGTRRIHIATKKFWLFRLVLRNTV